MRDYESLASRRCSHSALLRVVSFALAVLAAGGTAVAQQPYHHQRPPVVHPPHEAQRPYPPPQSAPVMRRTPTVPAQLTRLPRVAPERGQAMTAAERDELIVFAAGAIEAPAPPDWWVWELPAGREVRLAFSPRSPAKLNVPPTIGFWICYHAKPRSRSNQAQELVDFINQRMPSLAPQAVPVGENRSFHLGGWLAVEQDFSLPAGPLGEERVGPRGTLGNGRQTWGRHLAVRTPWGIFEVHARAPLETSHQAAAELADWLSQVSLNPPRIETLETRNWTAQAEPILGCWKAYRSRMRLFGDGRIEILSDAPSIVLPAREDRAMPPPRRELLIGEFRAEDDVLFIEWQDGSPLNFRWKLHEGELLLTDHDGQTSRLLRTYE